MNKFHHAIRTQHLLSFHTYTKLRSFIKNGSILTRFGTEYIKTKTDTYHFSVDGRKRSKMKQGPSGWIE